MKNHLHLIARQSVRKRYKIQVNIPTHNSYEVTKKTISCLLRQKGVSFDILVIDGGTNDYRRLKKDFPQINYILLKDNYGSAGAQRIGAEIALKYGYEYIVFTDNDAIPLTQDCLKLLKEKLDSSDDITGVIPRHVETYPKEVGKDFCTKGWAFHYLMVRTETIRRIGLHRFDLFLYSDDMALTFKLSSRGKLIVCDKVAYYHHKYSPKKFTIFYSYYYLRGLIIILTREKGINFAHRTTVSLLWIYKATQLLLSGVKFRKKSLLLLPLLGLLAGLFPKRNFLGHFSFSELNYIEVNKKEGVFLNKKHFYLTFPKEFYFYDYYHHSYKSFSLVTGIRKR